MKIRNLVFWQICSRGEKIAMPQKKKGKKGMISQKKYSVGMWYTRVSGSFTIEKVHFRD